MTDNSSPSRTSHQSQIPSLPALVAPWHQDHQDVSLTRSLPAPLTSSDKLSNASLKHSTRDLPFEDNIGRKATTKGVSIHLRNFSQSNSQNMQEETELMERSALKMIDELERLAERVSLNEKRIQAEDIQVSSLFQSRNETERTMMELQQNVTASREEQERILRVQSEKFQKLEQRQKSVVVTTQRSQEEISLQLDKVAETIHSLEGKVNRLEKKQSIMERVLVDTNEDIMHLKHKSAESEKKHAIMKRDLGEVSNEAMDLKLKNTELQKQMEIGLSKLEAGLRKVEERLESIIRDRREQDTQLRKSFHVVRTELSGTTVNLHQMFVDRLKENNQATALKISEHKDQVVDALCYVKEECFKQRESIKSELETRIAANEEAAEGAKSKCELQLKSITSNSKREAENVRMDLKKEMKGMVERGEERKKVLQGAVFVAEGEAEAVRQDLFKVVDAEIRTRSEEVETIWAELQRLSGEYRRHSQSVKTSLEVAEERVTANREQVQMLRDSLVGQWQEVGTQLLSDIDAKLSAHMATLSVCQPKLHPHPHPRPYETQSSPLTDQGNLTPYINFQGAPPEGSQLGTPLSQASYLMDDECDYRSKEGVEGQVQKHQLLSTRKYSSGSDPLHSKSCVLSQGHSIGRYSQDLASVAEKEEPITPYESVREETTETDRKTGDVRSGDTSESEMSDKKGAASTTPAKMSETTHPLANTEVSREKEEGSYASEHQAPERPQTTEYSPSEQQTDGHRESPEEWSDENHRSITNSPELLHNGTAEQQDREADQADQEYQQNDQEEVESEGRESENVVWRIGGSP